MKTTAYRFIAAASLLALAPLAAQANSIWHQGYGEETLTYHPEHVTQTRTRAQVAAELQTAQQNGSVPRAFIGAQHGPAEAGMTDSGLKRSADTKSQSRVNQLPQVYSGS